MLRPSERSIELEDKKSAKALLSHLEQLHRERSISQINKKVYSPRRTRRARRKESSHHNIIDFLPKSHIEGT